MSIFVVFGGGARGNTENNGFAIPDVNYDTVCRIVLILVVVFCSQNISEVSQKEINAFLF